jgi:hypothetical protein
MPLASPRAVSFSLWRGAPRRPKWLRGLTWRAGSGGIRRIGGTGDATGRSGIDKGAARIVRPARLERRMA